MGIVSVASASNLRSPNIAALQAIGGTSGGASATDLVWRVRMKVDGLNALAAFGGAGLIQVDDGTDANRKGQLFAGAGSTAGQWAFSLGIGASSGSWTTARYNPASYPALANGRYIVVLFYYLRSAYTFGYAIYDDTGTGTLVDGLAPGTSVFEATKAYNSAWPIITGNGQVVLNYAYNTSRWAQVYDSIYLLTALPTADAVPSTGILASWLFDDTPAEVTTSSGFSSTVPGTFPSGTILVISGTATALPGGAEAAQTYTPTTVTGTPASPTCTSTGAGDTVQLVPATQDQYGDTGTMGTRTYNYGVVSGGTYATVSGSGLVTGANAGAGTLVLSVTDTASGGSGATAWSVSVAITGPAATAYDWLSGNTAVATVPAGGAGDTQETVTAIGSGTTTITVTRQPSGPSCVIAVADTQSSGYPSFGYPNQPSGMTLISYRNAQTAAAGSESPGPWGSLSGGTNLSEIADATVPWGGPNVTQVLYPAGLAGGSTPTYNWCTIGGGYKRVYAAFAWKLQTGFVFNSSFVNKVGYMKPGNGVGGFASVFFVAFNTASGVYQPRWCTQGSGSVTVPTLDFAPNVAGNIGYVVSLGTWAIWEIFAQLNTAITSPYNGIFRMWLTVGGVTTQTHEYDNVALTLTANDTFDDEFDFQPYWGGSGGAVATNEYAYLGPVAVFGG